MQISSRHVVARTWLPSSLSPEQAVLWLRDERRPFALVGEWLGVRAVLGSDPVRVAAPAAEPFALLDEQVAGDPGDAVVGGGWVGWLGYGLGGRIERLVPAPPAPAPRAPFSLAFYDHVVVHDGEGWWFESLWTPARDAALRERLAVWRTRLMSSPPAASRAAPTPFAIAGNGGDGHVSAVAECRRRIAEGELLQANLCVRLEASFTGDPVELFARALPDARPRFGALLDGVVSLSPERFLRRRGRRVWSEPIKGTRPRTGNEAEQATALEALVASEKDAAEHVMIVDLMRNDLGRVCEYGTITVETARVEAHAGVWHLVSTVSGRLRAEVSDGALLRATFPPGSVTGAPKVQAMKVIAELEATQRELYTGALGMVSPVAGLDLGVAIRTFELKGDAIWFGVGGGIVAESDPESELAEALAKAAGPIAAIGSRLQPARRPRARSLPLRALTYGARPDPTRGVFETMLVEHGRVIELGAHIARLAASVSELYGTRLAPTVAQRAEAEAAAFGPGRGRLRIDADGDGAVEVRVSAAPAAPGEPVRLVPFVLPGGLGAHKWRDRHLLEVLSARARGGVPLLVDTDGVVLEAAYANVWIRVRDGLRTPPADGRILPGVTRAALLASDPTAREDTITLERLESAEAVFLTSSIAGHHPARLAPPGRSSNEARGAGRSCSTAP